MHPEGDYYLKELVRELNENNNALRRELNRLERIGLLCAEKRGPTKVYRVSRQHPLYPELKGLVLKTTGLGQAVRDRLTELGQIDIAFVYGSFARGEEDASSDIDLLIVGRVDLELLRPVLRELEQQLGREINETVYDFDEFIQRQREGDAFLRRVMAGPRIVLIGDADAVN